MASYTLKDVELIRQKSGMTYQEAISLLEYHGGNVAKALADLERSGRLKQPPVADRRGEDTSIIQKMYMCRIKVSRGEQLILNVSLLAALIILLISPHIVILALVSLIVLGYHISVDKCDLTFAKDRLDRMVKGAADSIKNSVDNITRSFTSQRPSTKHSSDPTGHNSDDYSTSTGQDSVHPLRVRNKKGDVVVESDDDGYHSATLD